MSIFYIFLIPLSIILGLGVLISALLGVVIVTMWLIKKVNKMI